MMLRGYEYILLTIVFTVFGQLMMKWRLSGLGFTLPVTGSAADKAVAVLRVFFDPYILSGYAASFLASLAWMVALTKFDLSTAYPFMALNFALVLLLSVFLLGETFTVYKLIGVLLIFAGVYVGSR